MPRIARRRLHGCRFSGRPRRKKHMRPLDSNRQGRCRNRMISHFRKFVLSTALVSVAIAVTHCGGKTHGETVAKTGAWTEPDPAKIPAGPVGDSIRAGRLIFNQ